MDNLDPSDTNSLARISAAHDTAMILFQIKPISNIRKPLKSEVNLKEIRSISLPCEGNTEFLTNKVINIPENLPLTKFTKFSLHLSFASFKDNSSSLTSNVLRNSNLTPEVDAPTWVEMNSLLTNRNLPIMYTSFIQHPVTDSSTVHTAMNNFVNILKQLDQNALVLFCDEGVYQIVADVYLKCPEKFKQLILCMGSFHMAKCVQHCIGKYVRRSGIEDAFIKTSASQINSRTILKWNTLRYIAKSYISFNWCNQSSKMGSLLGNAWHKQI